MSEDKLKRRCVKWLKESRINNIWFYCATDKFYSGIPDILFSYRGFFGWVELKTYKGKVSKIQQWTHDRLFEAGARGMVCRSFEEFRDFILGF